MTILRCKCGKPVVVNVDAPAICQDCAKTASVRERYPEATVEDVLRFDKAKSVKELAKELGTTEAEVKQGIRSMVREGTVKKVGKDKWRISL